MSLLFRRSEELARMQERAFGSEVLAELQRQQAEIRAAVERIRVGRYGRCGRCGDLISEGRLRMLPATDFCVKCAWEAQESA